MDSFNRFHTQTTYRLLKLDYLSVALLCSVLLALNFRSVDWIHFLIAFWWIDILGYLPGAIWFKRNPGPGFPAGFVVAYNTTHSIAINVAIWSVWMAFAGQWEWAMLAQPLHLCIDRGYFGNIYKPLGLSFEPKSHPLFEKFSIEFEAVNR